MTLSIRTRLTLWYAALLTISFLVSGAAFSYSLFKIFMNRIDSQIASVANMMPHTIMNPMGQILLPRDFDIILERFFGIRTAGNFIQVLDSRGQVVAKSSNLEDLVLPLSKDTFVAAHTGATTFEVVRNVGRYPIRVVTKPVVLKEKGTVAIVQVGNSLEGMEEIFHSLFYILGFGIVASVVTASVIGSFLARKALQPVSAITEMARKITAESLNERIDILVPQDEIGRLASTINGMIGRLEKSFRQIQQFTADASHELKTPLTVLKGEMEVALRSKDDPRYMREVIESSLEEIDRMSYIVRNLLDLAKMDVEREAIKNVEVGLDKVLSERFEHFKRLAVERGVGLRISKNAPSTVNGDPVRLSQLVFNLIDNALKYTPPGGAVELSLENSNGSAVMKVRDTGIGIAREDLPYIFDRFYRVDKARSRDAGGAGLGLSICREIVNSMRGEIGVESEPGRGSTFIVTLPLAVGAG